MGFMYFLEIYLKLNLSILDLYLKKLLESVFSLLYGRGR